MFVGQRYYDILIKEKIESEYNNNIIRIYTEQEDQSGNENINLHFFYLLVDFSHIIKTKNV